ncbi:MAG: hypothetical protein SF187_21510 [Deltaproteobacteria bacterium]|nr:hypothetical protein [Deltaproteobacteria bacterium]
MEQPHAPLIRSRADIALPVAIAFIALLWAWVASGPWLASGVNWDTASYVALYASGQGSPAQLPWNSHFGLGPVYAGGARLARLWGGSWLDGVRTVNAIALAGAAFVLARFGHHFAGVAGGLWSLLYVSSWGVAQLLLTLEDNVLYLPFGAALLSLALRHVHAWTARRSVAAGVLGACGVLMSWQAGLYLFPAIYVASVCGKRSPRVRVRDVALIIGAALVTLVAFVLAFGLWARDGLNDLFATLFSRPSPSFFPTSLAEFASLWLQRRRVLAQLGAGLAGQVGPYTATSNALTSVGLAAFVLIVAAAVSVWRRHHTPRLVWMIAFAAIALATALYLDLPVDAYKRYEFVPLFVTTGAAMATARVAKHKTLVAAFAVLCAVVSLSVDVVHARNYRERLPKLQPTHYHGFATEPWFVNFRRLRAEHPEACMFTLPLDKALLHGRYQLEIPAALWSELPAHQLVGDPALVQDWPRRVNVVPPERLPARLPCEWRAPTL